MRDNGSEVEHSSTTTTFPLVEPAIHAAEHIVPDLIPTAQTRTAAILWETMLRRGLQDAGIDIKDLPIDPLKFINPKTIAIAQKGLHSLETGITAMEGFNHAKESGASNTEAAALAALGAAAVVKSNNYLNKRYFSHIPHESRALFLRVGETFVKSFLTTAVSVSFIEAIPNYFALRQKYPNTISAISSLVGGFASFSYGCLGLGLIASGTAESATGVGTPLGVPQVTAGIFIISQTPKINRLTSQGTAEFLYKLPEYYESALLAAQKMPDIMSSAKSYVTHQWNSLKQNYTDSKADLINFFEKINQNTFANLAEIKKQYQLTDEQVLPFGVALSYEVGQIFQIESTGLKIQAPTSNLFDSRENFMPTQSNSETLSVTKAGLTRLDELTRRELANSQKIKEANEIILPVVKELVEVWTDNSANITGFEREKKVVDLKNELEELKNNSASPQAILAKVRDLNNAKAKVVCERQDFDQKVTNIGHALDGAASLANIFGNAKLANQIAVIGGSALKIGTVIAGFAGYGALAACINPLMATSMLLGCVADIKKLTNPNSDPTQELSRQISSLSQQIQTMFVTIMESFAEVMQGLNKISQDQIRHFFLLQGSLELISSKLALFEQTSTRNQNILKDYSQAVLRKIDTMVEEQQLRQKRETLLNIRQEVNEKVITAGLEKGVGTSYVEACAKIHGYISTKGSAISHLDLMGNMVDLTKIQELDQALSDNQPYFHLNTLTSYYCQIMLGSVPPSVNSMQVVLNNLLADNSHFILKDVVTLECLLEKRPTNSSIKLNLLIQTLMEENLNAKTILLIPIFINARWSLLLIDQQNQQTHYLTLPNCESVSHRLIGVVKAAGIKDENIIVTLINGNITPRQSHIWLIEAVKIILVSNDLLKSVVDASQLKITSETPQPQLESRAVFPNNPFIVEYLALKLLELTHMQYSELHKGGFSIRKPEVEGFQEIIKQSEIAYNLYVLFSDSKIFEKLIDDYYEALKNFGNQLHEENNKFDKIISDESNAAAKETAKRLYSSEAVTNEFKDEAIEIGLYGEWFSKETLDQVLHAKRGHSEVRRPNPNGYIYGADNDYKKQQKTQIVNAKDVIVQEKLKSFNSLILHNSLSSYNSFQAVDIILPNFIYPATQNFPILPAYNVIFSYVPDDISAIVKTAQALGHGYVNYTYDIQGDLFFIDINFDINSNNNAINRRICLSRLQGKYDALFYQGKEAVWFYAVGGNCAVTIQGTKRKVGRDETDGATGYHAEVNGPNLASREGYLSKMPPLVPILNRNDQALVEGLAILEAAVNRDVAAFQERFCKKLTGELKIGELDHSLTQLNAHYNLLKMFSLFMFPNCFSNKDSAIYQFFTQNEWVSNRATALAHLESRPHQLIVNALLPQQMLNDFKNEVKSLMANGAGLARLHEVDLLQHFLLEELNKFVQHTVQFRTMTEQLDFYKRLNQEVDDCLNQAYDKAKGHPERAVKMMELIQQGVVAKQELLRRFEENPSCDLNSLLAPFRQLLLGPTQHENTQQKKSIRVAEIYKSADSNLTFTRDQVVGDGDCGYTAFRILRSGALDLITSRLGEVVDILKPAIMEQLLQKKFIEYVASQALGNAFEAYMIAAQFGDEKSEDLLNDLYNHTNDLNIVRAYINYDIRDRKIDSGWSHPSTLQALAHLQGKRLRIWKLNDKNELVPHPDYPCIGAANATETNLLFVNNNHFDRLEICGSPSQTTAVRLSTHHDQFFGNPERKPSKEEVDDKSYDFTK